MPNLKLLKNTWPLIALLALAPLWALGLFNRGYWTPDEPREADIAWRMSIQTDRTLPHLADAPFLEKPPLSYWLSAAAIHAFGDSPSSARLPNLFYATITVLAMGALVYTMAGPAAAIIAALVAGSAFDAYQVAIWLAPDACLVMGCAVALLGMYRGYAATASREKLAWYTLMHVGALLGFMAKSGAAWVFIGLTWLVLLAWERRWNELKRWQLWAGLPIQLVFIGIWIVAVLHEANGAQALRVLFWNNLAGRFTDIHASGALNYASGHQNWPGKYLVELPYYLFPWTLLAAAALQRAWTMCRINNLAGTAWRFAIAASLPFLLLLSVASTARSVYAAPALLGMSVLIGLWAADFRITTRWTDIAISGTRYCAGALALFVVVALGIMAFAGSDAFVLMMTALLAVAGIAGFALWASAVSQRQRRFYWSISWAYAAYLAAITVGGSVLFVQIDQWQNLGALAQQIQQDLGNGTLALLSPDETTIAMMDHQLRTPFTILDGTAQEAPQLAVAWFYSHAQQGLILINLPGHAEGKLSQLLTRAHPKKTPDDGILQTLEQDNIAHVVKRYALPQGRRYALVASVNTPAPLRPIDNSLFE